MDIIRLRTLTRKSFLGFGNFADMTIDQIITLKKCTYLRWVYYNIEGISFMPDILKQMGILDNELIEKPGKNPDMVDIVYNRIKSKFKDPITNIIFGRATKKRNRTKYLSWDKSRSTFSNKEYLQRKNHGH